MVSRMRMCGMVMMVVVDRRGDGRCRVRLRVGREAEHIERAWSVINRIVVVVMVMMGMNVMMVVVSRRVVRLRSFSSSLVAAGLGPIHESIFVLGEATISLSSSYTSSASSSAPFDLGNGGTYKISAL